MDFFGVDTFADIAWILVPAIYKTYMKQIPYTTTTRPQAAKTSEKTNGKRSTYIIETCEMRAENYLHAVRANYG